MASNLDLELTLMVNEIARRYEDPRRVFQFFAVYGIYLLVASIGYLVYMFYRNQLQGLLSSTAKRLLVALVLTQIIKMAMNFAMPRPRPYVSFPILVQPRIAAPSSPYASMPSGHALVAFALAFEIQSWTVTLIRNLSSASASGAMGETWSCCGKMFNRYSFLATVSYIVAFMVSISRVACGVHYMGDIAVAFLIDWIVYFQLAPWILSWFVAKQ